MRLRSDHTEESHVKALQHDLRHAAEECQELHDEVAKEKKLRAESEEALRMEQSVFAEAEMALRGKISEKAGALEAERRLRAEAEASLRDMAAVSAALGAERKKSGELEAALAELQRTSSEKESSLRVDLTTAADALGSLDEEHRAQAARSSFKASCAWASSPRRKL